MKELQSRHSSSSILIFIAVVVSVSAISFGFGYLVGKRSGHFDEKGLVEIRTAENQQPNTSSGNDRGSLSVGPGAPETSPAPKDDKASPEKPMEASEKGLQAVAGKGEQNATPPAKPSPSESAAKEGTKYSVQVGAFKTLRDASVLKSNLQKKGYNTNIETVNKKKGKLYKVKVGTFSTREEAAKVSTELRKIKGLKPFIMVSR